MIKCTIAFSEIGLFHENHLLEFHEIHEIEKKNTFNHKLRNWNIEKTAEKILDNPVNRSQRIMKDLSNKLLLK